MGIGCSGLRAWCVTSRAANPETQYPAAKVSQIFVSQALLRFASVLVGCRRVQFGCFKVWAEGYHNAGVY